MMKPIDEAKRLLAEIADPVRSAKRRRVEEHAGTAALAGICLRKPLAVVDGQVLVGGDGRDGVALASKQRNSPPESSGGERR